MLDLFKEKGIPLEKQVFDWTDIARTPTSKLDVDAMTRVRIILMNGIESEASRFQHAFARINKDLRLDLARIRRTEQHQQTLVNWLLPADLSPLETTVGYEQVAIEVTASVAQHEPDTYLAQVYRFGMLEDFDHLYRFSALFDRVHGGDANTILQSYTDILPGRPTMVEQRAPQDDLRTAYNRKNAKPITKLNALTITAGENQTHDYYMTIGPMFADPVARALYAEIASIEEQHVTQYESLTDPDETPLEKWLLHEATEIYNYFSCLQYESDPAVKSVWERFLNYELGHLDHVVQLFKKHERRDPAEVIPASLPEPIEYRSHREFVRQTLSQEVDLRASGTRFIRTNGERESSASVSYRNQLNSKGSPSEAIAKGWFWKPGGEMAVQLPIAAKREREVA
jgi:rubrerythrin